MHTNIQSLTAQGAALKHNSGCASYSLFTGAKIFPIEIKKSSCYFIFLATELAEVFPPSPYMLKSITNPMRLFLLALQGWSWSCPPRFQCRGSVQGSPCLPQPVGSTHCSARGWQPSYCCSRGSSRSPLSRCWEEPGWPQGGPELRTHTQGVPSEPGRCSLRGTPAQPLGTPPLGTEKENLLQFKPGRCFRSIENP